jgi:hypothetical protein
MTGVVAAVGVERLVADAGTLAVGRPIAAPFLSWQSLTQ